MSVALAMFEPGYLKAATLAAAIELRVRLIGGAIESVACLRIDAHLEEVLDAIIKAQAAYLSDDDREVLRRARMLRNKLLHCEFSAVRKQLDRIAPRQRGPHVHALNVADLDGDALIAAVGGLAHGAAVGQTPVADTRMRSLSDMYGWLVEAGSAGEFEEAAEAFGSALAVLDTLPRT